MFIPTFSEAVSLVVFGAVFCFFVILAPAFQFLTGQAEGFAVVTAQASSYIDTIIKFEIGFGFAFELPIVVFFLVVWEIIPYRKLRSARRPVYGVLLVITAMVTPDASPGTMLLLFDAMVAMYEVSLLLSRLILAKRIKQQNERLDAEEAEEQEPKKASKAKK